MGLNTQKHIQLHLWTIEVYLIGNSFDVAFIVNGISVGKLSALNLYGSVDKQTDFYSNIWAFLLVCGLQFLVKTIGNITSVCNNMTIWGVNFICVGTLTSSRISQSLFMP